MQYERQEGAKVYEYFPLLRIEAVVYDFSKKVGDTISIFPRETASGLDTSIATVLGAGARYMFGETRKYMIFYARTIHVTLFWIDEVTDSIGRTFSEVEPGFQLSLVGAQINGTQYGTVTSVMDTRQEHPNGFSLLQNYPNPFNPSTTIYYDLPADSHVKILIYDILGREVRSLVDEQESAGYQKVRFDIQGVASGVYFYRIQADPLKGGKMFSDVKKMMVLK
jgi:hypothetical protein